jgi:hypothetical protein
MRAAPIAATVVALLFTSASFFGAEARPKKKKVKDEPEDISSYKKDLVVLSDEDGDIYVLESKWGAGGDEHAFFFGDGKVMYRQRVFGGGSDGQTGRIDFSFWSPRVDNSGTVGRTDKGEYYLSCSRAADAEQETLKKLSDADAKKVLDTASFRKFFWKRQAQALARDDSGNYYYVDRMRDEQGGKGHRIFAGPKGALKELPMTNVVSDSVGEIYATRKGELRFVTEPNKAWWIKGSVKTELTIIPIEDNIPLIYGDLGVYDGSLGTPCDDM